MGVEGGLASPGNKAAPLLLKFVQVSEEKRDKSDKSIKRQHKTKRKERPYQVR